MLIHTNLSTGLLTSHEPFEAGRTRIVSAESKTLCSFIHRDIRTSNCDPNEGSYTKSTFAFTRLHTFVVTPETNSSIIMARLHVSRAHKNLMLLGKKTGKVHEISFLVSVRASVCRESHPHPKNLDAASANVIRVDIDAGVSQRPYETLLR